MAVVFGGQDTRAATFDVAETDAEQVRQLRDGLLAQARKGHFKSDVFLAALAEAGSVMLEAWKEQAEHG